MSREMRILVVAIAAVVALYFALGEVLPNRWQVESTAQMADALGLEVVAEGVESQWVSDYLRDAGYGIGQGYWFGKPMTAAELVGRYPSQGAAPQAIAS